MLGFRLVREAVCLPKSALDQRSILTMRRSLPGYPDAQTFLQSVGMSRMGQKWSFENYDTSPAQVGSSADIRNRILTVFRVCSMLRRTITRSNELRDRKWDERFMLLAHHLAHWSVEQGRRVGAVIVGPDNEIRSTGYNGLPRGVNDALEERHSRVTGAKYVWSCHAEQNAIFNAARIGIALKGCAIYVPWFPCVECTKAIIQSGISEVVGYEPDRPDSNWARDFTIAGTMLEEANIIVRFIPKLAELPDVSEE